MGYGGVLVSQKDSHIGLCTFGPCEHLIICIGSCLGLCPVGFLWYQLGHTGQGFHVWTYSHRALFIHTYTHVYTHIHTHTNTHTHTKTYTYKTHTHTHVYAGPLYLYCTLNSKPYRARALFQIFCIVRNHRTQKKEKIFIFQTSLSSPPFCPKFLSLTILFHRSLSKK